MKFIILIFCLFSFTVLSLAQDDQEYQYRAYCDNGLPFDCHFAKRNVQMPTVVKEAISGLQTAFHQYAKIDQFHKNMTELMGSLEHPEPSWFCDRCMDFFGELNTKALNEIHLANVLEAVLGFGCGYFLNRSECDGAIQRYGPILLYNFIQKETNGKYHCNRMHMCNNGLNQLTFEDYQNEVLADKPETKQVRPTRTKGNYTMVHISDIHIDLDYTVGSNIDCNEYQCCDAFNGAPSSPENAAQFWGQRSVCDVPEILIERTIKHIAEEVKPDLLFWTGDSVDHKVWSQEQSTQTVQMHLITNYIKKYFANTSTIIFPMFGNHEAFPVDEYDLFTNKSDYILIDGSNWWADWLGPEAQQSFRENSYYSIYRPDYNLKVIAINTQVQDPLNFYVMQNPTDPLNQLAWLRQQLQDSEDKNQDVMIIGHIPPVSNVFSEWARRYATLIDRYTNIIKGIFYGHTHDDQTTVVRSFVTNEAVGAYFILPSLTTDTDRYPALRIYDIDRDTNTIINFRQQFLNLDKQNLNQDFDAPMAFEDDYDFCNLYNIQDYMSWENIGAWIDSFETNSTTLQSYIQKFTTGSSPVPLNVIETDKSLTTGYICNAKFSVFEDIAKCYKDNGIKSTSNDLYLILQDFVGPWYTYAEDMMNAKQ